MAKKQFKSESKRLLDLMINSIYTHKEIFLREIISNASDAIDKLCYISLTDEAVGMARSDFRISITADKAEGTITVSDNGVGMTKDELESNLGVIARSGSLKFKDGIGDNAENADIDIIGQFGVGFYSAFMVSDKVTVISKAYGSECACKWESSGTDGYTVTDWDKSGVGTDVIIHLKPDTQDERYSTYLESWKIRELVKKYSDYIRWPIIMDVEHTETRATGEKDEKGEPKTEHITAMEAQTVNSMIPIWQRSKSEATDEDCIAFYKEKFHDNTDPVSVIRISAEGTVSYRALLFIPAAAPYDYFTRDYEPGLQLYSSGVMIMEKCADLVPECFRFARGVVDSPDLSLNISREMLQHDRQLRVIANNLEKKIKTELKRLMDNEPDKYEKFYKSFALQLKYGLVADYGAKKEMLSELLMFYSSKEKELVPLAEYVKKMPEDQKHIYYACAQSTVRADALPQTEQLKEKGFEIFYLTDDIDEFVVQTIRTFMDKTFCNVTADDLEIETAEEKKEAEKLEADSKQLLGFVKDSLNSAVFDVRISHKLRTHPVCLSTEGDVTLEMERYFRSIPGAPGDGIKAKRVLELNGSHSAFKSLKKAFEEDKPKAEKLAKILFSQANLIAGLPIDDPSEYTELVCSLF